MNKLEYQVKTTSFWRNYL